MTTHSSSRNGEADCSEVIYSGVHEAQIGIALAVGHLAATVVQLSAGL